MVEWFEVDGDWVRVVEPWVWPASFPSTGGSPNMDPEERKRRIASMKEALAILDEREESDSAKLAMRRNATISGLGLAFKLPI